MNYNFDEVIDRNNTNSIKWDMKPGVLPMWVADMDFKAAPCILEALQRKLDHGVFGYTKVPDSYFESVCGWFARRHGWKIEKDWIVPICGLVPGSAVAVGALVKPGDKVILQSPDYNAFYPVVQNLGCEVADDILLYDEAACTYSMDYDRLEQLCSDPAVKAAIICNPANPAGRLWTAEELRRAGDICNRHGVTVISDEIHCEIAPPGSHYIPYGTLGEEYQMNSICMNSPTKGFNIAGLEISNMVIANPVIREKVRQTMTAWQHNDIGQFGVVALQAAYTPEGEEWLDQMNAYIHDNYLAACEFIARELPGFAVTPLEATYLLWMRCAPLDGVISTEELMNRLIDSEKVWVNSGDMYHGPGFLRINLACPRSVLLEGLTRMARGIREILHN